MKRRRPRKIQPKRWGVVLCGGVVGAILFRSKAEAEADAKKIGAGTYVVPVRVTEIMPTKRKAKR